MEYAKLFHVMAANLELALLAALAVSIVETVGAVRVLENGKADCLYCPSLDENRTTDSETEIVHS